MSSLIKSAKLAHLCLKHTPVALTATRNHWNKDYKPGPYPRTEQERLRAAERYGLHPSEYEPYPDDGYGYGDYPKLPDISGDAKDPYYPYDNPELKRNFNEPLHAEFDLMREDRYNVSARLRYPLWFQWVQFLGVMLGSFGIYCLFEQVKMFHPVVPRQYPKDGPHYTFEPK
ncbi:NADH dehydrogenase [ubiquinone] 1 beta subcomplex subunit 8, mitochondrial [Tribolium madens]|uniref:NADH dehydrogenase [ubiquinone] 1 beta subcomplex subunit 8, mitochondrial n=1 Tax=Tribolium madens TaxID=41895 RepID=UPI001CF75E68|nr:NADH dehydrogenase [ubiquinone] 1 beta subcomplex subunit 8, mitochondrial [Tribolium madens]